jgi:hypothetical protein
MSSGNDEKQRATSVRISAEARDVLERISEGQGGAPFSHTLERILFWMAQFPRLEREPFRPFPNRPGMVEKLAEWCEEHDRDVGYMLSSLIAFAAEREEEFREYVRR